MKDSQYHYVRTRYTFAEKKRTMRQIDTIIIHCSATPEGKEFFAKDIDRWHRERGFRCIGYHYVIDLNGRIEKGRDISQMGAHCLGQNASSIGICYIGGQDKNGKAKDTRTKEQVEALHELVNSLMQQHNIGLERVYGHYQFEKKDCPCFTMEQFRKEYYERYY